MQLYLLRHGDAVQNPALHDSERPLTPLGQQQASTAARFLRASGIAVDAVFSSPLKRARETAAPVETALNIEKRFTTEFLVPGTDPRQLFDEINAHSFKSVLLVGHEPLMGTLVSVLTSGDSELKVDFKKCSLALVETLAPVKKGRGMLQWLIQVGQMEKLGG
ncbi:MAG: phosphohistidine phosphatase SixA [Bacteroidota bacterium]